MRKYISMVVVISFITTLVLFSCASVKKPAEEALKAAEQAVNQAKTEAGKIVPDQVSSLESALSGAKEKFSKGDYKAALAEAQAIPGKAKEVLEAAKAKKEELTKTWNDLSQSLPKMLGAIKSKVDALSKTRKLPAKLTREKLSEVKSNLSETMKEWEVSLESFKGENLVDAVTKANSIKEKAIQMLQTLGMPVSQAAKS